MISLTINNVPTLFIKAFTQADVQSILEFVRHADSFYSGSGNRVLFIDTPITAATVEAVERLTTERYRVVFRDHHGIDGQPTNDREQKVVAAAARLESLLGDDCRITVRRLYPACSQLVQVGEFADAVAIIADPDADGLTAAMKATGISYEGLDEDAAKLDGEPQCQVTGTPISQLLAKGIATIPSYDATKPKEREIAYQKLFADWLKAVEGDSNALKRLEDRVHVYEDAVHVAHELATTAVVAAPGVFLVDVTGKPLYDPGTLMSLLEQDSRCRVIVMRKSLGPIAALHGIQYSLSVAKRFQNVINLHDLLEPTAKSDPEIGIISNVSFLLHVSEDIWESQVQPRLHKLAE
jgi:hypothetical protein